MDHLHHATQVLHPLRIGICYQEGLRPWIVIATARGCALYGCYREGRCPWRHGAGQLMREGRCPWRHGIGQLIREGHCPWTRSALRDSLISAGALPFHCSECLDIDVLTYFVAMLLQLEPGFCYIRHPWLQWRATISATTRGCALSCCYREGRCPWCHGGDLLIREGQCPWTLATLRDSLPSAGALPFYCNECLGIDVLIFPGAMLLQ